MGIVLNRPGAPRTSLTYLVSEQSDDDPKRQKQLGSASEVDVLGLLGFCSLTPMFKVVLAQCQRESSVVASNRRM